MRFWLEGALCPPQKIAIAWISVERSVASRIKCQATKGRTAGLPCRRHRDTRQTRRWAIPKGNGVVVLRPTHKSNTLEIKLNVEGGAHLERANPIQD